MIIGWKKSSVFARLYRWFYNIDESEMPDNLCPYFWRTVFMYIFIIPYTILCLPVIILGLFDNDWKFTPIGERISFSIIAYLLMLMIWSVLFVPYYLFMWGPVNFGNIFFEFLFMLGISIWLFGIVVLLYSGIRYLIKGKNSSTPKSNMVVEVIKAKYHKYCPKINWEE